MELHVLARALVPDRREIDVAVEFPRIGMIHREIEQRSGSIEGIDAAKKLRERGELPPTVDNAALYRVRGTAARLPKDVPWIPATAPWREAFSEGPPTENASCLALSPDGKLLAVSAYGTVGASTEDHGQHGHVIRLFETEIERCQLEMRRGTLSAASTAFLQAVARAPDSVRAHYGLAESLRLAGDAIGAADHYRACLALDPADRVAQRPLDTLG